MSNRAIDGEHGVRPPMHPRGSAVTSAKSCERSASRAAVPRSARARCKLELRLAGAALQQLIAMAALFACSIDPLGCGGSIIQTPDETVDAGPGPEAAASVPIPPIDGSSNHRDGPVDAPRNPTTNDAAADAAPDTAAKDAMPATKDAIADAHRDDAADALDIRDAPSDVCIRANTCPPPAMCGTMIGNCGQTVTCGYCVTGATCGADNVCHCPPATCPPGVNCGTITNECGSTISCGTCVPPEVCGGAGTPNVCGIDHQCDGNTVTCIKSRDLSPDGCYQCALQLGCFDPALQAHVCEDLTAPAPAACQAVLGSASVPTEAQICLETLKEIFDTHCASGLQINPCLCGTTAPDRCQNGAETPTGPLYPLYQCDLGPSINTLVPNLGSPTQGAGVANAIIQCLQGYGCDCQY